MDYMNPSSKEGSSSPMALTLPEQPAAPGAAIESAADSPEQAAGAERAPLPSSAPAAMAAPAATIPLPLTTPFTVPSNDSAGVAIQMQNASLAADDTDLIEKEWVNKAKADRRTDARRPLSPKQSELTAVKADYMKKRYNKTIKSG
jgi:hypothetical protein